MTAAFDVARGHPARALLADNGIAAEDELILRRVQLADGRTRAFVNDQPVSVQVLKQLGSALVEIHGQHDERALVDAATHRRLLDAFGGLEGRGRGGRALWQARRDARRGGRCASRRGRARQARGATGCATRSRSSTSLRRKAGEETALAERRTAMMQAEKVAEDLRDAHEVDRRHELPACPRCRASSGGWNGAPRRRPA